MLILKGSRGLKTRSGLRVDVTHNGKTWAGVWKFGGNILLFERVKVKPKYINYNYIFAIFDPTQC